MQEYGGLSVFTLCFQLQKNPQPSVPGRESGRRQSQAERRGGKALQAVKGGLGTFSLHCVLSSQTAAMCFCQPCSHHGLCSQHSPGMEQKSKTREKGGLRKEESEQEIMLLLHCPGCYARCLRSPLISKGMEQKSFRDGW